MAFQYQKYADFLKKDTGNAPVLKPGQKALIWKPSIENGKLSKSWAGPYVIKKRISKDTYVLSDPEAKRNFRRHLRHLRPLHPGVTQGDPEPDCDSEKSEQNSDLENRDEFENRSNFFKLPFGRFESET